MDTGAWVPEPLAPSGVRLDDRQKLACLHRVLAATGFNENMAGHVTMAGTRWPPSQVDPLALRNGEYAASGHVSISGP